MPTALELTRKDWRSYIEGHSLRPTLRELTPGEQRERSHLLARAKEVAATLKSRFAVRRVVLFGSLAHESWFVSGSDVDLAIEGLDARYYWEAWRLAEEIIKDRPVDLIEIEAATESLKGAIERYGVEL
jgi:predicted nucleotidyltransferase